MNTYIAFLRGINVSGQKIIKMAELSEMFSALKFQNVRTYIQSGNVVFDSKEKDIIKLETIIEKEILKTFGFDVVVFIRIKKELEKIVSKNPFKKVISETPKFYVTFIKQDFPHKLKLPHLSEKHGVEIISVEGNNIFCNSHLLKNNNWGFPNLLLEKEYKLPATTRNINTIEKILKM